MKSNVKILSLIFALLMLAAIFCGCVEDIPSDTTASAQTDVTTAEVIETEPAAPAFYDIVKNGVCLYKLVYPADLASDSAEVKTAINIRKALEKLASSVELGDDFLAEGKTHDSDALEIIVGFTNHDEVEKAAEGASDEISVIFDAGEEDWNE